TKKVFLKKRAIIGVLLLLGFCGILVMNRSNQIFSKDRVTSLGWRAVIWQNSLVMIKERPFFGYVINTYMKLLPYYQEGKSKQNPSYAHNCFLQLAAETGLLGLSAFLGMMITMFRGTITGIMMLQKTNDEVAKLMLGLLSGCLAFLIQSFFDTNLYSLKLSVYFWLIVGVIFSLYNLFCAKENCGINNV
ncbi:MAG: O-antigen ligase family protein, partial [Candidatus Omnitrophica bacterium]|nr:O-antigen ligase family protein [Candidatus Omnitrophota bacterium]